MNTNEAREQVVKDLEESLLREKEEDLFATHVTTEMKVEYFDRHSKFIDEVRLGLHDSNFTIWQRMNYYIAGKCVPLFSK